MKNKYLLYFFLFIILVFAAFFRLYKLDKVPAGFNFDEAMVGYNAYTLGKWGMDQSGNKNPLLYVQSSVTFHQAPFFYITVLTEKILGVSKFALRLTPALLGILDVLLVFFLVKTIFAKNKNRHWIALCATLLTALSSWHIYISRSGYELTIAQFFFLLGLYVFIKNNNRLRNIFFTLVLFILSALTYRSYLIFLPLYFGILFVLFQKELKKSAVRLVFLFLALLFIIVSLFLAINDPRKSDTIFNHLQSVSGLVLILNTFLRSYIVHFSLLLNFAPTAFDPKYWLVNQGLFYLFELPLFILGLIYLVKYNKGPLKIILPWLFLYPIAHSLTTFGYANRMAIILPLPQILAGIGLWWLLKSVPKKFWMVFFAIILFSFINFWVDYYSYYPRRYGNFNHEGPEYVYDYVKTQGFHYKRVFIHNFDPVFFLFFSKFDLPTYLADKKSYTHIGKTKIFAKLHNIYFVDNIYNLKPEPDDLFIDQKESFPKGVKPLKIIYLQNSSEFAWIVSGRELLNKQL